MARDGDITDPERQPGETIDRALRPTAFDDFTGQQAPKPTSKSSSPPPAIAAMRSITSCSPARRASARRRWRRSSAREMGVGFRSTSGPVIAKAGDLAALLTNLEPRDVLFIDEIHRLPAHVEEILYPAMEDHTLDLIIGEGPSARSVKIDLPPFTLVGATTRAGLLSTPLRDRFGIPIRLEFYTREELGSILKRAGAEAAAPTSRRMAPRKSPAVRAARPASPSASSAASAISAKPMASKIDRAGAANALARLEVDEDGLDALDRRYLQALVKTYSRRPRRRRHAGRRAVRSARRHRGSDRALPDAAGLRRPHPARPRRHAKSLGTRRPQSRPPPSRQPLFEDDDEDERSP